MMGHTHILIGGAAWLGFQAIAVAMGHPEVGAGIALGGWFIASFAALLPDIDTKNSLASKFFGWVTEAVSWIIRKSTGGHRKITHSLLGVAIIWALMSAAIVGLHMAPWIGLAVVIGWCSHIAADMLTREGCPLLWPFSRYKFGLHLVTTGLGKKNGRHTSEWWLISPLAIGATIVFALMLLAGL